eukprot:6202701-Pleurochrysis_carterae.AAC.1
MDKYPHERRDAESQPSHHASQRITRLNPNVSPDLSPDRGSDPNSSLFSVTPNPNAEPELIPRSSRSRPPPRAPHPSSSTLPRLDARRCRRHPRRVRRDSLPLQQDHLGLHDHGRHLRLDLRLCRAVLLNFGHAALHVHRLHHVRAHAGHPTHFPAFESASALGCVSWATER